MQIYVAYQTLFILYSSREVKVVAVRNLKAYRRVELKLHFKNVKVKFSRYRPGVAQRVGRGIALLFHDRGTRRGLVVSSTPRPHFIPGKGSVPNLQEAGWAPGQV